MIIRDIYFIVRKSFFFLLRYVNIPNLFLCFVFCRTTQEHGELLDVLDINSLHYSKFNAIYPTKIIIHGFGGGRNLVPSTDLRNGTCFNFHLRF